MYALTHTATRSSQVKCEHNPNLERLTLARYRLDWSILPIARTIRKKSSPMGFKALSFMPDESIQLTLFPSPEQALHALPFRSHSFLIPSPNLQPICKPLNKH